MVKLTIIPKTENNRNNISSQQEEDQVPLIQEEGPHSPTVKSVKKGGRCMASLQILVRTLVHQIWYWSSSGMLLAVLCYLYLGGGVLLFLLVTLTCLGMLFNSQDLILYYPDQPDSSRLFVPPPSAVGIHTSLCENIYIQTVDSIRINALLVKQQPSLVHMVPTILLFHGNAGNIGHRLINAAVFHSLCHCNVLLVEYRGYGKSEGEPSEEGLYLDAQSSLDYLHSRSDINSNLIFAFGRSLGGAVAIDLASHPRNRGRIRGLIIENTFTSIPDMGCHLFKLELIKWIPLFIIKNKYFSMQKIPKVKVPSLFLSGAADELVPPEMMRTLFERCGGPKKMAVFENGSHNETWQLPGYCDTVNEFLARHTGITVHHPPSRPLPDPPNISHQHPKQRTEVMNGENGSSSSSYEFINL